MYREGTTARRGIESPDLHFKLVLFASGSSESDSSSDKDRRFCTLVREVRLGGIHRSFRGALIIWGVGSDEPMTVGALKSIT